MASSVLSPRFPAVLHDTLKYSNFANIKQKGGTFTAAGNEAVWQSLFALNFQ